MTENKGYTHPEALVDAEWVQSALLYGVGEDAEFIASAIAGKR